MQGPGQALALKQIPIPAPAADEVRIRVQWCGVCRTDLHIRDGDLTPPQWPVIPGHEIIGHIDACGSSVTGLRKGQWVGVPWLGRTCGQCRWCCSGQENLCDSAEFTGFSRPGGYAEFLTISAQFCFPLADSLRNAASAPLLCAGLIGYRTLRRAGTPVQRIGLYGFGAAAHLLVPITQHLGMQTYAFTRPGDTASQAFALELGCDWVGGTDTNPPQLLDAALIFAPAGELVPLALSHLAKAGKVVCGGIHMSDIPSFPYSDLWQEREIRSVANLTRTDGEELLALAAELQLAAQVRLYALEEAESALDDLRQGHLQGAAVLQL
jgi:propanol-preferring alcohol dehydrogenase